MEANNKNTPDKTKAVGNNLEPNEPQPEETAPPEVTGSDVGVVDDSSTHEFASSMEERRRDEGRDLDGRQGEVEKEEPHGSRGSDGR